MLIRCNSHKICGEFFYLLLSLYFNVACCLMFLLSINVVRLFLDYYGFFFLVFLCVKTSFDFQESQDHCCLTITGNCSYNVTAGKFFQWPNEVLQQKIGYV